MRDSSVELLLFLIVVCFAVKMLYVIMILSAECWVLNAECWVQVASMLEGYSGSDITAVVKVQQLYCHLLCQQPPLL